MNRKQLTSLRIFTFNMKRKEQFERKKTQEHLISAEEKRREYMKSVRAKRSTEQKEEEQKKDRDRKQLERAQQRLKKHYTFLYKKKLTQMLCLKGNNQRTINSIDLSKISILH